MATDREGEDIARLFAAHTEPAPSAVGVDIYWQRDPAHYTGGIGVTVAYPEGALDQKQKSAIKEGILAVFRNLR